MTESLYSELNAEAIGLGGFQNDYSGPHVWTKRWREYILGTIGVGIALGDIDGDGLPDLFVASKDEESKLYRNLGDCRFEDISAASGFKDAEDPASGCSFVDVDNDGDLDLYALYVAGKNQLWINDGSGRFTEEAAKWGIDIDNGCTMASFADYDRDGDLDFYLQNNMLNEGEEYQKLEDQLFENIGGRYREATLEAGISGKGHGHSALFWDYNEDGWPDIYVANDFEDLDKLYRNNKDGTFTDVLSEAAPHVPYYSMGADFGDINNDGHSDFWVADMAATTREHHLRTVGNHDHVYKHDPEGEAHQYLKNALLLKLDRNRFAETAFLSGLAATDWTWAARLVDMNNDGWLDAYVTNGMLRSFHDADLGAKQGAFASHDWMTIVFRREPVMNERNLAYENLGGLQFQERSTDWGVDKLSVSFGASFGDLDRDGDLDFVTNNFQDKISVFRNHDTKNNRIVVKLRGSESNSFGIGARVRIESGGLIQVKEMALMRGYMSSDQPIMHFGLGKHETIDRLTVDWPSGARQVFTGLLANREFEISERKTEIPEAWTPLEARTVFVEIPFDLPTEASRKEAYHSDFQRQTLLPFPQSRLGGDIALGDLNGDSRLDMVLGGASGQDTMVLLQGEGDAFVGALSLDLEDDFGCEDRNVVLHDWDEDGDLDLLVASGGVELDTGDPFYEDRLYINDGFGDFTRRWDAGLPGMAEATGVIAMADFDGDGDLDVFSGGASIAHKYPGAYPSRLLRNDSGKLMPMDAVDTLGLGSLGVIGGASWSDIDLDGDQDLLVAPEWSSPMILENMGGEFRPARPLLGESRIRGLWSTLAVADLDENGLPDIVLGNLGLNTEYRASKARPIRLWHSPLDGPDVKLIESSIEDGREWTREAKWRLEKEFPREMRRVRSYQQFASMPLPELFPDLAGRGFALLEADELRSGILWQFAKGEFEFQPLPSFSQAGRANGILIVDVNGDGTQDIVMSLEHVSPEPWSGRFESGYLGLFVNRGDRRFESLLPRDSGLVVDGSPRALAWGDIDGDGSPDLAVQLSEGLPRMFSLSGGRNER